MPEKRRPKLGKFFAFLADLFNFKSLLIEKILKFTYVLFTIFAIVFGFCMLFVVSYGESMALYGVLIMVAGPIALRLVYELSMFEYVNTDAKECYSKVESKLVGSSLEKGVNMVIETAEADGYLEDNKTVTIDVVEAKQTDEKLELLTTAMESAKKFITEQKIEAEVVLIETAQKEVDDKATADKAATDKAAEEKAAAEKAAAEKEKKNPIKNLKKGVKYCIIKPDAEGNMLTGIFIKFNENGEYSYTMVPCSQDDFGQGELIVYNGKTYYEAGGGGGGGTYVLTDENITMSGGFDMVLTMTTDGELVVEKLDSASDFFKVGDILKLN